MPEHEQQPNTDNGQIDAIDTDAEQIHPGLVSYLMRWLIGAAVGFMIFVIAFVAAWPSVRHNSFTGDGQWWTGKTIHDINYAIKDFKERHNRFPSTLTELVAEDRDRWRLDDESNIPDGWGRPFIYSVEGDKYLVLSYGYDGKPGGVGLDFDLSSDNISTDGPRTEQERITLKQFLLDMPFLANQYGAFIRRIIIACGLIGICATLVCRTVIKPTKISFPEITQFIAKAMILTIAAIVTSTIVAVLHYPSGH